MSTYYKVGGETVYRIAAARVTYERADGTIGELNMSGGGGGGSSDWADITNKPATFPPEVGIGAAQAKAGNWFPAWGEVTGKPAVIASGATQAAARDTILAALRGANADITSLAGLTTPLSLPQGGTGVTTIADLGSLLGISALTSGLAPPISNIDTQTTTTIRSLTATTTGRPTGSGNGDLFVMFASATTAVQIVIQTGTSNVMVLRTFNQTNQTWRTWSSITMTPL